MANGWMMTIIMKLLQQLLNDEHPNLDGYQNNGLSPVKGDALQIQWVTPSSI